MTPAVPLRSYEAHRQLCLTRRTWTWGAPCYHSSLIRTHTYTRTHTCVSAWSVRVVIMVCLAIPVSLLTVIARCHCTHTHAYMHASSQIWLLPQRYEQKRVGCWQVVMNKGVEFSHSTQYTEAHAIQVFRNNINVLLPHREILIYVYYYVPSQPLSSNVFRAYIFHRIRYNVIIWW